jgi:hypothetical protein
LHIFSSEEDFCFGVHEFSSIDSIEIDKNELIVLDCLEFSSTAHLKSLNQTQSSIPLLSTRVDKNQRVISSTSGDNVLYSSSKSNDKLKTRNSD